MAQLVVSPTKPNKLRSPVNKKKLPLNASSSSALWLYNRSSARFSLHLVYLNSEVIPAIPETAHRLTGQWIYQRDLSRDLVLKQHIRERVPVLYDVDHHPDITTWQRQFLKRLGVETMLGIPLLLRSEIVFDPRTENGGFGLMGMSDRAARLNGQLTIDSYPGHGTEIRVEVPIE